MAGSRTEAIGSIFTRVRGLLRSGAMKQEEKPIWYNIYEAFPPAVEPKLDRMIRTKEPREIVYKEDFIRTKFYKTFRTSEPVVMFNDSEPSLCQLFIEQYRELEKSGSVEDPDNLFKETAREMRRQGRLLHEVKKAMKVAEDTPTDTGNTQEDATLQTDSTETTSPTSSTSPS